MVFRKILFLLFYIFNNSSKNLGGFYSELPLNLVHLCFWTLILTFLFKFRISTLGPKTSGTTITPSQTVNSFASTTPRDQSSNSLKPISTKRKSSSNISDRFSAGSCCGSATGSTSWAPSWRSEPPNLSSESSTTAGSSFNAETRGSCRRRTWASRPTWTRSETTSSTGSSRVRPAVRSWRMTCQFFRSLIEIWRKNRSNIGTTTALSTKISSGFRLR